MPANAMAPANACGRFLVVLTDVRPLGEGCKRDERVYPERRRRIVHVDNDPAAVVSLARALASLGMVRAGRQRVKVIGIARRARR